MKCQDLIQGDVVCCRGSDTVEQCARLMKDRDVGFIPVTDDGGKLVGTVTDRDLCINVLAAGKVGSTKVQDVMSKGVVTCKPSDDVSAAEQQMATHKIQRIVVVDGDRCVGIISHQDIVLREGSAERTQQVQRAIKSDGAKSSQMRQS